MQIEIVLVAALFVVMIIVNNKESLKKFVVGDDSTIGFLKEKDYEFLVLAKYGDTANSKILFTKRIKYAGYVMLFALIFYINDMSFMSIIKILLFGIIMFKLPYFSLKSYHKKYMAKVDQMLPYYLKG